MTYDQGLWVLTAHPDTLLLSESAPEWLVEECRALGIVEAAGPGAWKLTAAGFAERKRLLQEPTS
ncbi:hypothetical protein [Telmatospirillum sp.]|uniref:hypothetical protein n=1 Tax=Telmatospirillum sp. TaxID=2079197 RepID=UPI0028406A56|nr:hypothetical protein [Telmatospirillum sp.]MDR3436419.1 hypothetical protein [Telmatospirillum sp.]